jgi:hypothetical protein
VGVCCGRRSQKGLRTSWRMAGGTVLGEGFKVKGK